MGHPFRNIVGIIILISGIYLAGQNFLEPIIASSALPAAVAAKPCGPVLQSGALAWPNLDARAFLSAYLAPNGAREILVERGGHKQVPIASVTKLMTALVAAGDLNLNATTSLRTSGKIFTVRTLLDSLLVESSNESAAALATLGGDDKFVEQMNQTAARLGMKETHYANASGLDEASGSNFSSAYDLLALTEQLLAQRPELLALTRQVTVPIVDSSGREDHIAQATDELLTANHWPAEIVGGKTGTTPLAKTNLVLVLRDRATGGYLINVLLGSEDHFGEMTKLIDWVYQSYKF